VDLISTGPERPLGGGGEKKNQKKKRKGKEGVRGDHAETDPTIFLFTVSCLHLFKLANAPHAQKRGGRGGKKGGGNQPSPGNPRPTIPFAPESSSLEFFLQLPSQGEKRERKGARNANIPPYHPDSSIGLPPSLFLFPTLERDEGRKKRKEV